MGLTKSPSLFYLFLTISGLAFGAAKIHQFFVLCFRFVFLFSVFVLKTPARDDAALRRDLIDTMKSSNETFTEAMKSVGESMKLLSQSMASSIQTLANCLSPQPAFHPHQEMMGNMFQQRSMMDILASTQVHKDSNFMVSPRNMTGSGESYTYEQL